MNLTAALILAAATASTPPPAPPGVQLASAQARATIVTPAIVRQSSGVQEDLDAPRPQISRHGQTILVEFQ